MRLLLDSAVITHALCALAVYAQRFRGAIFQKETKTVFYGTNGSCVHTARDVFLCNYLCISNDDCTGSVYQDVTGQCLLLLREPEAATPTTASFKGQFWRYNDLNKDRSRTKRRELSKYQPQWKGMLTGNGSLLVAPSKLGSKNRLRELSIKDASMYKYPSFSSSYISSLVYYCRRKWIIVGLSRQRKVVRTTRGKDDGVTPVWNKGVWSMALDNENHVLFMLLDVGTLTRLHLRGSEHTVSKNVWDMRSVTVDPKRKKVYVGSREEIIELSYDYKQKKAMVKGNKLHAYDLAFNPSNDMLYYIDGKDIKQTSVVGGGNSVFTSLIYTPQSLVYHAGNIFASVAGNVIAVVDAEKELAYVDVDYPNMTRLVFAVLS